MKIVIFGSRDICDYNLIRGHLNVYFKMHPMKITEIVSGVAKGIDTLAVYYARENGIPVKEFPAQWMVNGIFKKNAGMIRNNQMAKYADLGICFWDGKSKGTKHMINTLKKYNKEVYITILSNN